MENTANLGENYSTFKSTLSLANRHSKVCVYDHRIRSSHFSSGLGLKKLKDLLIPSGLSFLWREGSVESGETIKVLATIQSCFDSGLGE